MTYVLPPNDLQEVLKLHAENRDGLAYRHIAEAVERDRGHVHPCVIDWLMISAEAGRKNSWAKALGFSLNNQQSDNLARGIAQNFFGLLRKNEGVMPSMETIVSLSGMSAARETGESKSFNSSLPGRSSLQRVMSGEEKVN